MNTPQDPSDFLRRASELQKSGDIHGAEKTYRTALATGIEHKNIYLGLAALLNTQGRPQEARDTLNAAILKYPDSPAVIAAMGALLLHLNDTHNAVAYFEKLVSRLPNHVGALHDLAVAYARNLEWDRARENAEKVLSKHPENSSMLQVLSTALSLTGHVVQSLAVYDRLAAVRPLEYTSVFPPRNEANAPMFSRNQPSPRYAELSQQYELMHSENTDDGDLTFAGIMTFLRVAPYIRDLFKDKDYQTVLDYGGGKGQQYTLKDIRDKSDASYNDMSAYLGVDSVKVYDAGRPETSSAVGQKYDAVICTDVLEHCDRLDLPWIVRELFEHADKAVFATIATYPAGKHLPNGENAHCTLESAEWWTALFSACAQEFPAVDYAYLVVNDAGFNAVEAFAGGPSRSSG